jgi:hypothetical protein
MPRQRGSSNWFSRFSGGKRRTARSGSRRHKRDYLPGVESLETRALLARVTLFVDFGDVNNGPDAKITAGDLYQLAHGPDLVKEDAMAMPTPFPANDPGHSLYDANQELDIRPLQRVLGDRGIDFDGNGVVNAADNSALITSTLSILQRIFAPFDVNIQQANNTSMSAVGALLASAPAGSAYVYACGLTKPNSGGGNMGGALAGTVAGDREATTANTNANPPDPGTVVFGDSSTQDVGTGTNPTSETAFVYAEALAQFSNSAKYGYSMDVALANIIARQAGITFGLAPTGASLTTSSDVMRTDVEVNDNTVAPETPDNASLLNIGMFMRYPVRTVNIWSTGDPTKTPAVAPKAVAPKAQNAYDLLKTNIGVNSVATQFPYSDYITGTGAFDQIVIKKSAMAGKADVTVTAYTDDTFTTPLIVTGSNPASAAFTTTVDISKGAFIDLGRSDDQIAIDGTLSAAKTINLSIFGGQGQSELDLIGDGTTSVGTFAPNNTTSTTPGLGTSTGGTLSVLDASQKITLSVAMSEFTNDSTAFVNRFTDFAYQAVGAVNVNLFTGGLPDNGGVVAINGQVVDATGVPNDTMFLDFQEIPNFAVDCSQLPGNNLLTIGDGGLPAKNLTNFVYLGGVGNDTLDIATPNIELPVAGGAFTYDGGDGTDTIATDSDSDFTLTEDTLFSAGGGEVELVNLTGEIAELTGGDSDNTLTVFSWSGTGTLSGLGGNDNFVLGEAADIDTVTGHFAVSGGDGVDTLQLDDSGDSDAVNYDILASTVEDNPLTPNGFGGVDFDTSVDNIVLTGSQAGNHFFVTPNLFTTMHVNGVNPVLGTLPPDGDFLFVDFTGTTGRHLTTNVTPKAPGNGAWTFTDGHKAIIYTGIEQIQSSLVAAAADAGLGSKPLVKVYNNISKEVQFSFYAYEQSYKGGVRVAMADINGDGVLDVITAPGAGRVGEVKVFDGATLFTLGLLSPTPTHLVANPSVAQLGTSFKPEGTAYRGGLYVAAGDLDGDGQLEIVTSRSAGAPKVRAFAVGPGFTYTQVLAFAPYKPIEHVINGAVVAVGDVNGDGLAEIVTAPGTGSVNRVKVFDGQGALLEQFLGFESTFRNGVSIGVGDTDGDGQAEIMLGAGAGGHSRVRILDQFGHLEREFKAFTTGNVNAPLRLATRIADDRVLLYIAQSNDGRSREIHLFDPLTGEFVDKIFDTEPVFNGGIWMG